jgi:hypothetical protein
MIQKVTTPVTREWLDSLIDGTFIENVIPGINGTLHLGEAEVDRADKLSAILSHLADAIHDAGFVLLSSDPDCGTCDLANLTAEEMRCHICDCKASVRAVNIDDNGNYICGACCKK